MPRGRQEGWLLLADISGYTAFLTGSELEHAHAILEDLMRGLLRSLRAPLRVVKLEGDAVLAYALAGDLAQGVALLDRLEDVYHSFRMHLFSIGRASTCTCAACTNTANLDLKMMVHYGEFIVYDLTGQEDLQGPDVILVHRLLKNEVMERQGMRAYLLATDAARARISGLSWIEHRETYEHIGDLACGVRDLHAAFATYATSGAADVTEADADVITTYDLPVPVETAWAWHVDEDKAGRWQTGLNAWSLTAGSNGQIRAGGSAHCAHGQKIKSMQIQSWRPGHSATFASPEFHGQPPMRMTMSFEPLEGGAASRVSLRFKLTERSWPNRMKAWLMSLFGPWMMRKNAERLRGLMASEAKESPVLASRGA